MMALSLKPERIKRYRDVVALLIKYGRPDLVQQSDLEVAGGGHGEALATRTEPKAEELASDLRRRTRRETLLSAKKARQGR
jgi:hypothetical protein